MEDSILLSQRQMSYRSQGEFDNAQNSGLDMQSLAESSIQCQTQSSSTRQGLYLSKVVQHASDTSAYIEVFGTSFGQMNCDYDMEWEDGEVQCHFLAHSDLHGSLHVLPEAQIAREQEGSPLVQSPRAYGRYAINQLVPGEPTRFDFVTSGDVLHQDCNLRVSRSVQAQRVKQLQKIIFRGLACKNTCLHDYTKGFQNDDVGKAVLALMPQIAKTGNMEQMERCVALMISLGPSPLLFRVLNIALDACKKHGNLAKAVAWWDRIVALDLARDPIAYNTMISVCVRAGNLELTEWWIERMLENGISPCLMSFTKFIKACGQLGFVDRAEYWLKRMHDQGLQADVVLQNAMIVAYSNNGNVRKAEATFYEMQKEGVALCQRTFNVLIHANAKHRSLERADYWYREMNSSGFRPDQYTYGSLFAGCMRQLDTSRMEYYLERMVSEKLSLNHVCMRSIVKVYMDCAEGDRLANVLGWCLRRHAVAHHVVRDVLSMKQTRVASAALGELHARLCTTCPEL
eukprot:TRINITY_DN6531_c0_g1_i2.p1 TRINITY_DN6531_c0_g1~~TRINITY_DN6531_c0_g1_i2.p1  ORF type:complete len:515 (-),score=67.21 TRINITY_DN6531_c0_g1_i2:313-1857(-)